MAAFPYPTSISLLLWESNVKSTVLLCGVCIVLTCWQKAPASLKHRLWGLSLIALLLIPFLTRMLPSWQFQLLPSLTKFLDRPWSADPRTPPILPPNANASSKTKLLDLAEERGRISRSPVPLSHVSKPAGHPAGQDTASVIRPTASDDLLTSSWISLAISILVGVWVLGLVWMMFKLGQGIHLTWKLRGESRLVTESEWVQLLNEMQDRLGLRGSIELRELRSHCRYFRKLSPLTWGVFRPAILLPADTTNWNRETRQAVLLHELAHVKRADVLMQLAGRLSAAVYWFHPLVWYALDQLRKERELASDDLVIQSGVLASGYATQLLEVARQCCWSPRLVMAVEMSQGGNLERRLHALFDSNRSHAPLRMPGTMLSLATVSLTTLALATMKSPPAVSSSPPPAIQPNYQKSPQVQSNPRSTATPAANDAAKGDRQILRVTVEDAGSQKPVSSATVILRYYDTDAHVQQQTISSDQFLKPLASRTLKTDASGQFYLPLPAEISNRECYLEREVWHPDYVVSRSFGSWELTARVLADPEKLRALETVRLVPGHVVTGQVLNTEQQPVDNVPIHVAAQYPEYLGRRPLTVTDQSGRYRVRIPDRDHRIYILPNDAPGISLVVNKRYGEQPKVQLERGIQIMGRLLDRDGQGVPGVVIQGNGGDSLFHGVEVPLYKVPTDKLGYYKLPPVGLNRQVDVRVDVRGYWGAWRPRGQHPLDVYLPQLVSVPLLSRHAENKQQTLEINFLPTRTVTLTLRYLKGDGTPKNGAHIEFYGSSPTGTGPRWRGFFEAKADQPGVYTLKVPFGLTDATIDLWQDAEGRQGQTSATRLSHVDEPGNTTRVEARYSKVTRDDDSLLLQDPATE